MRFDALAWLSLVLALPASAGSEDPQPVISIGGRDFFSWQEYASSPEFIELGLHCKTRVSIPETEALPSDCSYTMTNPTFEYDPTVVYEIPIVFHVIQKLDGTGFIPMSLILSQVDILNEDFLALPGTNGANGNDAAIQFVLATTDPQGNPTTGVTYSMNDQWFADGGAYFETLAWDTNRYLNIYTNNASGNLGYVPDLPQGNVAGQKFDRVVMLWACVGANAPIGPPFDQGRIGTHEVGHYLGLYHTFQGGCTDPNQCYTQGDRICETLPEAGPNNGCIDNPPTCGDPDPILNYMDYTNDICMEEFTLEQVRRMRCSMEFYRPQLFTVIGGPNASTYCTAKKNTENCLPQIAFAGTPSESYAGPFNLMAERVLNNKNGLLFYGIGRNNLPFLGGTLCVQTPIRRTTVQNSGGNPPPDDCSGTFVFDMNPLIQLDLDPQLFPGSTFNSQYWSRDPLSSFGASLTDAAEATILP